MRPSTLRPKPSWWSKFASGSKRHLTKEPPQRASLEEKSYPHPDYPQTMSAKESSEHHAGRPSVAHDTVSNSTDDIIEIESAQSDEEEESQKPTSLPERTKTPAYVAPIPKIGSIPPISPNIPERPSLPPFVGSFLLGKQVDESGDIIDDKTGQVLARAGGDLPSIVGRRVSNRQGDILGDDGELLGYVADIEIERKGSTSSAQSPRTPGPKSLLDLMRRSSASLMVDEAGNILDANGNIVGKFHDNNNPLHRKEKEKEKEKTPAPETQKPLPPQPMQEEPQQDEPGPEPEQRRPRRTEEERRANAEAWRKEKPGESPSDIFLDVKSTTEGIQLTIRIPTVFGGQQVRPNISFS